ncbi:MAG: DsrE family protein [Marinicella sp.]|nr:DsrE family protein [Xanthomonadales bacterium]
MKFNLIINPSHQWQQSLVHALELMQVINKQGHHVVSVFFYGDAVHIAQDLLLQQAWSKAANSTELLLCRTMIEEYGIEPQLASGFKVVGMGQLALNMEQADRTLELN